MQSIVIAVFSLCGVLLGAGMQYLSGRALNARKQLILQKTQAYVDYFRALALVAQNGQSKEILSMAVDAKSRICIYGSPSAITHLREFESSGAKTDTTEGRAAVIALLAEVRKEIGRRDRTITGSDLHKVLFGEK
jgi:hypothetical protein